MQSDAAVKPVYLYLSEHKAPRANWRSGQWMIMRGRPLACDRWLIRHIESRGASDGDRWGWSSGSLARGSSMTHRCHTDYRLYFLSPISKTGGGQSNTHARHTYLHSIDCRLGCKCGNGLRWQDYIVSKQHSLSDCQWTLDTWCLFLYLKWLLKKQNNLKMVCWS